MQDRELPIPAPFLYQLWPMFYQRPFPIHSAVLSGFRNSSGRAARLATRDADATAALPLYTQHLLDHTLQHTNTLTQHTTHTHTSDGF